MRSLSECSSTWSPYFLPQLWVQSLSLLRIMNYFIFWDHLWDEIFLIFAYQNCLSLLFTYAIVYLVYVAYLQPFRSNKSRCMINDKHTAWYYKSYMFYYTTLSINHIAYICIQGRVEKMDSVNYKHICTVYMIIIEIYTQSISHTHFILPENQVWEE